MTATTTSAKRARTTSMAFINSCTPPALPRLPRLGLVVGAPLRSLDHLICPLQERRRDREAEGLGGLEVENYRLMHAIRPLAASTHGLRRKRGSSGDQSWGSTRGARSSG